MLDATSNVRRCNREANLVKGLHARAAWLERSPERRSSFLRQTDRMVSLLCVLSVLSVSESVLVSASCACMYVLQACERACVRVCTCHASTCVRMRVRVRVRVPSGVSARARARSLRRDSRFQSSMTRSSSPRAMRSAAGPRGLVAAQAGLHGDTLRARYWPVSGRGWDRLPSFSSSRRNESGRETADDGLPYTRSWPLHSSRGERRLECVRSAGPRVNRRRCVGEAVHRSGRRSFNC